LDIEGFRKTGDTAKRGKEERKGEKKKFNWHCVLRLFALEGAHAVGNRGGKGKGGKGREEGGKKREKKKERNPGLATHCKPAFCTASAKRAGATKGKEREREKEKIRGGNQIPHSALFSILSDPIRDVQISLKTATGCKEGGKKGKRRKKKKKWHCSVVSDCFFLACKTTTGSVDGTQWGEEEEEKKKKRGGVDNMTHSCC